MGEKGSEGESNWKGRHYPECSRTVTEVSRIEGGRKDEIVARQKGGRGLTRGRRKTRRGGMWVGRRMEGVGEARLERSTHPEDTGSRGGLIQGVN